MGEADEHKTKEEHNVYHLHVFNANEFTDLFFKSL